ncbi:2-amino-4-hydroxy-6-hydroxymethyldihydropteridine diphosphokinase [Sulfurimonas sp. C5]|uniref:2-amino-4-hydroxy-6- hydroxymethyldihydropteridine diphosphokinase n=1 Tax=Sulfurimonas sp. C5 TaxID=3036947 RepID=UPI002458AC90|nr:2-amino-4-hydroxy-6-hydroxymethyldihydropteridine diphosphokinase [Sulfurimonas sp. C5]MDH4945340.1 2-amino-4-hydroxy-6-hydroxymethyldihydropteridine diphosphokinase [Sulfurimonas sp. C5]
MYLQRKISDKLVSFHTLRYPFVKPIRSKHRYEVVVGIGGNVGDVRRRFEHLFVMLQREKRAELFKTSLILKNPPFGYTAQDDFFNSIMCFKTSMQPKEFLRYLLRVEKHFGRKRSFANAPRTLDLDIIFFDNRTIDTKDLTVPHPHWYKRESVVIPLLGAAL